MGGVETDFVIVVEATPKAEVSLVKLNIGEAKCGVEADDTRLVAIDVAETCVGLVAFTELGSTELVVSEACDGFASLGASVEI